MGKMKVLVIFSIDAQGFVNEGVSEEKFWNQEKVQYKGNSVKKGYDYDIREFKTQEEVDAYVLGLEDGNGWISDPYYSIIKLTL